VGAVSFALNKRPGVSEKTRARILRAAKRLGYTPDAELTRLMARVSTRRTREQHAVLAFINGFAERQIWKSNASVKRFWEGSVARSRELGYRVEVFWYHEPGMTPQRLRQILLARGIRGLLISANPPTNPEVRFDFDFSGFAAALSGFCFAEPALSFVLPDHFNNVLLALSQAYARGYRRPLLLQMGRWTRHSHYLEGAYHHFVAKHPDVASLPVCSLESYHLEPLTAAIRSHRPDAILSTATPDWPTVLEAHFRRKFGWIDLGWLPESGPVCGVDRRLGEQAGFVVDLVVDAIHRNEFGVPALRKELLVPGRWVEGSSLPSLGSH
jgi:LacI family transcriptional regulator